MSEADIAPRNRAESSGHPLKDREARPAIRAARDQKAIWRGVVVHVHRVVLRTLHDAVPDPRPSRQRGCHDTDTVANTPKAVAWQLHLLSAFGRLNTDRSIHTHFHLARLDRSDAM